jgi:hypothetical protein
MFVVGGIAPAAALAFTIWGIFPLIGIDPNGGISPSAEPIRFMWIALSFCLALILDFVLFAVLAAWLALHKFARDDVESEFCWLLSFGRFTAPGRRLFSLLFAARNNR